MKQKRMKYSDMTYRDYDALAYNPKIHGDDERVAVNHIAKKRLKNKTNEVVFNPADHKEFITGFRKRKLQRRNKAIKELEVKARNDRLQTRADKRAKLKDELGVGDDWDLDSDAAEGKHAEAEEAEGAAGADVRVYDAPGVTTTVTTVALDSGPESSSSEDEEEDEPMLKEGAAAAHRLATKGKPPRGTSKQQQQYKSKQQYKGKGKRDGDEDEEGGHERVGQSKAAKMLQRLTMKSKKGYKSRKKALPKVGAGAKPMKK